MEEGIGIACGQCDTFNPMGTRACGACAHDLSLDPEGRAAGEAGADPGEAASAQPAPPPPTAAAAVSEKQPLRDTADAVARPPGPPPPPPPPTAQATAQPTQEELMEQARNYICKQCSTPVPSGHKFCGACGGNVPPEIQHLQTDYFGAMQAPGKARLILIRGDQGVDGLSYLLQGTEHIAGRQDAQILFPEDSWLSPKHANFIYRGEKLVVRDEGSVNGVYVRVTQPVEIKTGDQFLCGEQIFRLEATPKDTSGPDPDQTYFYSSPKRPSPFRVTQVLTGGAEGMVFCARENTGTVGREECDMNFPEDIYMSGSHAKIEMTGDGKFSLVDTGSKNGTYVRIGGEHELTHGDYLFLGKQLLRVEMTA